MQSVKEITKQTTVYTPWVAGSQVCHNHRRPSFHLLQSDHISSSKSLRTQVVILHLAHDPRRPNINCVSPRTNNPLKFVLWPNGDAETEDVHKSNLQEYGCPSNRRNSSQNDRFMPPDEAAYEGEKKRNHLRTPPLQSVKTLHHSKTAESSTRSEIPPTVAILNVNTTHLPFKTPKVHQVYIPTPARNRNLSAHNSTQELPTPPVNSTPSPLTTNIHAPQMVKTTFKPQFLSSTHPKNHSTTWSKDPELALNSKPPTISPDPEKPHTLIWPKLKTSKRAPKTGRLSPKTTATQQD